MSPHLARVRCSEAHFRKRSEFLNYEVVGKLILEPNLLIFKLPRGTQADSYCRARILF